MLAAGSVVTVLCLLAAGAFFGVHRKLDLIPRLQGDISLDEVVETEPRNYLLVGSDSREGLDADADGAGVFIGGPGGAEPSGERADMMMVIRVDPNGERLDILSLPRDLWVPIAGTGESQRLNTAYAGGPQRLIDTIRQDFGIEIHHYVEIDFVGFKGIVDAVDGVPVWFDTPMRDQNSGLDIPVAGCVTLDGFQALAFARARALEYQGDDGAWRTDPTGDLGRMSRQQVFMRAVADKAAEDFSLTDLRSLNRMADLAIDHLTLDPDLEVTKAINVARQFATFEGESIVFHSLPVEGFTTGGGAAVVRLDEVAAQPVLNVFRAEPVTDLPVAAVSLLVHNGTGTPGQAGGVATDLTEVGFDVRGTGDAVEMTEMTTVRHGSGAEVPAVLVARHLSTGARIEMDPTLDAATVVLVTGQDLGSVLSEPLPEDHPSVVRSTSAPAPVDAPAATSPTTTSTVIGRTPGEPPDGVVCA